MCTYSTDKNLAANLETITAERARAIIEMNKKGEKPLSLLEDDKARVMEGPKDLLAGGDISRFDKAKKKKNKNNRNKNKGPRNSGQQPAENNNAQPAEKNVQQPAENTQQAQPNNNQHRNNRRNNYKKNVQR